MSIFVWVAAIMCLCVLLYFVPRMVVWWLSRGQFNRD